MDNVGHRSLDRIVCWQIRGIGKRKNRETAYGEPADDKKEMLLFAGEITDPAEQRGKVYQKRGLKKEKADRGVGTEKGPKRPADRRGKKGGISREE